MKQRKVYDIHRSSTSPDGKYAIDNGNKAATEHYSKEFCVQLNESTLSTWKSKYYKEIKRLSKNRQFAESGEITVTTLPNLKQSSPLLVGDTLIIRCNLMFVPHVVLEEWSPLQWFWQLARL